MSLFFLEPREMKQCIWEQELHMFTKYTGCITALIFQVKGGKSFLPCNFFTLSQKLHSLHCVLLIVLV